MKQLVTFPSLTPDISTIFGLISDFYAIYAFVFMAASLAMTRVLVSDWYGKLISMLAAPLRLISLTAASLAFRVPVVIQALSRMFKNTVRLISFR